MLTPLKKLTIDVRIFFAFAAIYFVWGSTFYGVMIALKSFPPFLLSSLRLLIAGSVLLVVCVVKKEQIPTLIDIIKNMLCGLVIFIGGVVCVVLAQQYIASSLASIIITTPFWFVVLDKRQWHFYFSNKWIVTGLIVGLLGVILLLGGRENHFTSSNEDTELLSILIIILGSCLWTIGSLYLRYKPPNATIFVNTCIQLLAAGIFCFLISIMQQEVHHFSIASMRTDSVVAILYLSLVSSLATFMAYSWLITVRPPAVVSTYSYVNPAVAVFIGWGLAGEHISLLQITALSIILCGVFLVNIPKYKK